MTKKADRKTGWSDALTTIGKRLQQRSLLSPEQATTLEALASEFDTLAKEDPAATGPLVATLFWGIEFERLSQQQAQAAGMVAWVRSAVALTEEQRKLLKTRLREMFGQEFVLRVEVDPSLIGGMVVRAKDRVFDGSLAGRLDGLGERLRSAAEEQRSLASELETEPEKE
jgi:F-type H+-transporting ATPase subunit delta